MEDFLALVEPESRRVVAKQMLLGFFNCCRSDPSRWLLFLLGTMWPSLNPCTTQRNCQVAFLSIENYLMTLSTEAREQLVTFWQHYMSKLSKEVLAVKAVWA